MDVSDHLWPSVLANIFSILIGFQVHKAEIDFNFVFMCQMFRNIVKELKNIGVWGYTFSPGNSVMLSFVNRGNKN